MPTSEFQFLGVSHIVVLVLTITLPVTLSALVRKVEDSRCCTGVDSSVVANVVCYLLGATLIVNEVGLWVYRMATVESFSEFLQRHLPLHICGIALFVVVFTLFRRNQTLYEVAYFWGIVGTLNAVLTPQLEVGFPHYRFFQYFIVHGGIVRQCAVCDVGIENAPHLQRFVALILARQSLYGGYRGNQSIAEI